MTEPLLVICSYRPKPFQDTALWAIMAEHVPVLQALGLATGRAPIHGQGEGGVLIEIFEWASDAASRAALDHPDVKRIWAQFAQVCDFVGLASLVETQTPFAHFRPI